MTTGMRARLALGVLLVLTLLTWGQGLSAPYVFDDIETIRDNPHVRTLWPPLVPLTAPPQSPVAGRPVASLSLSLNHALTGLDVRGFRAFSILCHLLNVVLVWSLLRRLLRLPRLAPLAGGAADGLALACAALFALHPLQSEAVTYLTQRTELLVTLFLLATLRFSLEGLLAREGRRWFGLAVLACVLGMGSKEVMVGAPLAVLLMDRAFVSGSFGAALRGRPRFYAALAGCWLVLLALMIGGPRSDSVGFDHGIGAWENLLTQSQVLVRYLSLSAWPAGLTLAYEWPVVRSLSEAWPTFAAIALLFAATLVLVARNAPAGFAAALAFLVLAPSSSFVPISTEIAAERRMYLPLAALAALLVLGAWRLLGALGAVRARLGGAAAAALALACVLGSSARLQDWSDEHAIWSDTLEKEPGSFYAQCHYADTLQRQGDLEGAIERFRFIVDTTPGYPRARLFLADALVDAGRLSESLRWYGEASYLDPADAVVQNNTGSVLARLGRLDEAYARFRRALALRPDYVDALANLALTCLGTGRIDEAGPPLARALELWPDHPLANEVFERLLAGGRPAPL